MIPLYLWIVFGCFVCSNIPMRVDVSLYVRPSAWRGMLVLFPCYSVSNLGFIIVPNASVWVWILCASDIFVTILCLSFRLNLYNTAVRFWITWSKLRPETIYSRFISLFWFVLLGYSWSKRKLAEDRWQAVVFLLLSLLVGVLSPVNR